MRTRFLQPVFRYSATLLLVLLVSFFRIPETAAQNFWQPTNGPSDVVINALAINSDGHIFAGSSYGDIFIPGASTGGVFRSIDNGDSWTPLINFNVHSLAINPATEDIFAGKIAQFPDSGGVYRSMDNGGTWKLIKKLIPVVRAFAIIGPYIFVGTSAGVCYSLNNGENWTFINSGLKELNVCALASTAGAGVQVYAGTFGGGVFFLRGIGQNWVEINKGLTNKFVQALAINSSGHVFAGTQAGVFRSTDDGQNWTEVNMDSTHTNVNALAINSSGHIFVATGHEVSIPKLGGKVFRSTNNGDTWESVNTGLPDNIVTFSLAINSDGYIYAGTGSGVYRSIKSTLSPIVKTNPATNVTSNSATLNGAVNPNGLSTAVKFEYGTTTTYGRKVAATPSPVSGSTSVPVNATLTKLSPNTTYHYRVAATNSADSTNGDDQTFTTLLPPYPDTLLLNATITFPAFSRAGDFRDVDYQIVGLPGNSDSSVAKYLRGNHKKDWQVYWDNGAASNFLVEYNGGPEFNFKLGRALWIIHKGSLVFINRAVPAAPLSPSAPLTSAQIKVPLRSGWNLIANPYNRSVAWARIRDANNPKVTDPIWAFNQTYSQADSLKPYAGYYFYNRQNLDTLKIPYNLYYPPASVPAAVVEPTLWRVHIALSSGEFIEKATSFGVSHEARPELDEFDFHKPRAIATIPSVVFNRSTWDKSYGIFATDIRPEFEEHESWDFEVLSEQREPMKLTFSGIYRIPAHFAVYLIDAERARYVNLRDDSLYNFTPATDITKFTVRVGKAEALQKDLDALIPKEFTLEQNFPNPFNPTTAILITVPVTTEVKLKIYNLLGKEVKTLHSGSLEPGRHFFNWDGRDEIGNVLATGVYFYRLTTNARVTLVGKMILIR